MKINIITLGCSKNTVDSETLATQLGAGNIEFVFDNYNYNTKTVVINTCGFIADAKEQSINTILNFAKAKTDKQIDNLYVIGCLSERYKEYLEKEIPEVDNYFGVNNLSISKVLGRVIKYNDRYIIATYHPSYVLRNSDNNWIINKHINSFRKVAILYKEFINPLIQFKI